MSKRNKLTASDIHSAINELLVTPQSELEKLRTGELRKRLGFCGVTYVECLNAREIGRKNQRRYYKAGDSLRRADATKEECLHEIKKIIRPHAELATAVKFDESVLSAPLTEIDELVTALVEEYETPKSAAATINYMIERDYADEEGQPRHNLRTVKRSEYNSKLFRKLNEKGLFSRDEVEQRFLQFKHELIKLGRTDQEEKKREYKKRLVKREDSNREITGELNADEIINWCEDVLSNLTNQSKWWDVVSAVAITCGRRITSELLIDNTEIVEIGTREVEFVGKAKVKYDYEDSDQSYTVPTLIDADLVVQGFNWIQEHKAIRCEDFPDIRDARKRAHSKYNSDLGKRWKVIASRFGLDQIQDTTGEKVELPLMKTHGARKLYVNVILAREGLTEGKVHTDVIRRRAKEVLIHDDDKSNEWYRLPVKVIANDK